MYSCVRTHNFWRDKMNVSGSDKKLNISELFEAVGEINRNLLSLPAMLAACEQADNSQDLKGSEVRGLVAAAEEEGKNAKAVNKSSSDLIKEINAILKQIDIMVNISSDKSLFKRAQRRDSMHAGFISKSFIKVRANKEHDVGAELRNKTNQIIASLTFLQSRINHSEIDTTAPHSSLADPSIEDVLVDIKTKADFLAGKIDKTINVTETFPAPTGMILGESDEEATSTMSTDSESDADPDSSRLSSSSGVSQGNCDEERASSVMSTHSDADADPDSLRLRGSSGGTLGSLCCGTIFLLGVVSLGFFSNTKKDSEHLYFSSKLTPIQNVTAQALLAFIIGCSLVKVAYLSAGYCGLPSPLRTKSGQREQHENGLGDALLESGPESPGAGC